MQVTVIDTETTGFDPLENSVVEIASVDLTSGSWHQSLVKPDHPISFPAMATHMITEEMVDNAPSIEMTDAYAVCNVSNVLVAHNVEFDQAFLKIQDPSIRWICTYRCAMHLFPDAQSHRNMSLAYELGLNFSDAPKIESAEDPNASMPHRALFDAWVTRKLLIRMMEELADRLSERDLEGYGKDDAIRELVAMSTEPVLLKKVGFGKHFGELWSEVPQSYLTWIRRNGDFDQDVMHTVNYWSR